MPGNPWRRYFRRMDRKTAGALLLLVAVLTAVIVPRFDGTLTGGSAQAAPVDPPPGVGSCISGFDSGGPADPVERSDAPSVLVPSARYGPCQSPIAGEVLSVQTATELGDQVSPAAYDTASAGCSKGIDAYLGEPVGLNPALEATEWLPAARYTTVLVGPDAHQRAAGRTWSACVVTPVATPDYSRPVRGGFTDGSLEDGFGYCLNSTNLSDWVPCTAPHGAQVLAWGTPVRIGTGPSEADCLAAAATLMQTKDPTKGGALDVGLIGYEGSGSVQACGIRVDGDSRLTRSLIGIRDATLPMTG